MLRKIKKGLKKAIRWYAERMANTLPFTPTGSFPNLV